MRRSYVVKLLDCRPKCFWFKSRPRQNISVLCAHCFGPGKMSGRLRLRFSTSDWDLKYGQPSPTPGWKL